MGTLGTSIGARAIARGSAFHGLAFRVAGETFVLMSKLSRLPVQKVAVGHTDTSAAVVPTGEALTRAWAPASPGGAQRVTHFALRHTLPARPIMLDVQSLFRRPPEQPGPVQRMVVAQLPVGTYIDTPSTNLFQGSEAQRRHVQVLHDQQREAPVVEASAPDGREVGKNAEVVHVGRPGLYIQVA